MLQQTRVATVIPYWENWMAKFPTVTSLADAPADDVLAAWAGLGYYSRARNLQKGARELVAKWGGALPPTAEQLHGIPGIGPYTAGAIASIAFGERTPIVDGNVARVVARVFALEVDIKSTAGTRAAWTRAAELVATLPEDLAPGDLNQGLMELGATVCTPTSPRCASCPIAASCAAARDGRQGELPVMPKRKRADELPVIEREQLWIEERGTIVLVRRAPDAGLWGGLWELPELGVVDGGLELVGDIVAYHDQVLSHRRLRVRVRCARLVDASDRLVMAAIPGYDRIERVALDDAATYGIAAATATIIRKYQDSPWTSTPLPSRSSPRATRRSSRASAGSGSTSPTRTSRTPRRAPRKGSTS